MRPRLIIIGAGISGLALGWFLKKRFVNDLNLTILEASDRVGGWIRTHHEQGFLFEEGPRSCRTKGAGLDTLQLIEELGITDQVICASPEAKKRYLYSNGKIEALPNTLFSFLRSPLMKGVIPALWKEWRVPPSTVDDESIADFIGRRLSKEIAEGLMDPLVSGIYAGDIHKLSLRSCFPEMFRLEQEYGSLLKGMFRKKKRESSSSTFVETLRQSPIFSFRKGMETLVQALHVQLNEEIRLACPAKTIFCKNGKVEVELHDGERLIADHVFLAVPAPIAAQLVKTVDPISSETMAQSPYASVGVVGMGWHDKVLNYEGFGYLVPSSQKQDVLGVVFDSSVFVEQDHTGKQTRLTVMVGGTNSPGIEKISFDELKKISQKSIYQHLGISSSPDVMHITLAKQAIPQYEVGHQAKLLKMKTDLQRASSSCLSLMGSAWHGVAVNECVAEARKMADVGINDKEWSKRAGRMN